MTTHRRLSDGVRVTLTKADFEANPSLYVATRAYMPKRDGIALSGINGDGGVTKIGTPVDLTLAQYTGSAGDFDPLPDEASVAEAEAAVVKAKAAAEQAEKDRVARVAAHAAWEKEQADKERARLAAAQAERDGAARAARTATTPRSEPDPTPPRSKR